MVNRTAFTMIAWGMISLSPVSVIGIRGRAGMLVDAIGLICDEP